MKLSQQADYALTVILQLSPEDAVKLFCRWNLTSYLDGGRFFEEDNSKVSQS